jgi:hypothetical protein
MEGDELESVIPSQAIAEEWLATFCARYDKIHGRLPWGRRILGAYPPIGLVGAPLVAYVES